MSLNRLMLRALAINALLPQPGDGAPITMAGENVFDSRLDPTQFSADTNELPIIIVYTDGDGAQLVNRSDNSGPFRRGVDLRIEIVMGSFDTFIEDEKAHLAFGVPTTDAELEAKLDMFEQQVRWALLSWPVRNATNAFKRFVVRFENIESHVSRDESGNNRLAMRRLNIHCVINDDCPPGWTSAPYSGEREVTLTEDDFKPLPEWLRPMLVALQSSPSVRQVINVLSGRNDPAVIVPLLKRIGVNVDYVWPAADPTLLARLGKTRGPDGRLEYISTWELP